MSKSKIEWTDRTWNPVTGCTKVSQGCKNCYAERLYERFNGHGSFKNVICHPERLQQPLKWKQPALVFVNSMSDLFHEDVPFEFIKEVFGIMYWAKKHTFQVLTKRPERMLEFYTWLFKRRGMNLNDVQAESNNVWLGVSVEDQKAADERIPLLMKVPAVVRFLSCEPLLGPIDLTNITNRICADDADIKPLFGNTQILDVIHGELIHGRVGYNAPQINWVIAGGESGPGARPMHPNWARSLRDQCSAAALPFFFKQWGEWVDFEQMQQEYQLKLRRGTATHHIQNFELNPPFIYTAHRLGKHNAGNLLDGKQHLEYPSQIANHQN